MHKLIESRNHMLQCCNKVPMEVILKNKARKDKGGVYSTSMVLFKAFLLNVG